MLRVVSVLALVSACAPAVSGVHTELGATPVPHREAVKPLHEPAVAPRARASRLAPPFERSSGVRRVTSSADGAPAAPAILAAAELRD